MPDTNSEPPLSPQAALDEAVQAHLGAQLRALYADPAGDKLPRSLQQLAVRVSQVIRAHNEPVNQSFTDGIMASLPNLRAFAISLTKDSTKAEDLVQDTVLKAIGYSDRFEEGTNLQAWLFTILRNQFFSSHRKAGREVEDADGSLAASMISIPEQEDRIAHKELETALAQLSQDQREAILLVGMEGMQYEEAAIALGCAIGTVKSRVFRARSRLAELMHLDASDLGGNRTSGA
ncbi:sigma-70 family RNA polymerase sigma factor [Microvirga pudoricolor]|uniref:sigma-70 family RNA polymerase sigma factor n=1 Tax=Microvirga pudoricolor TaxID=2778729 RepID=UPI0019519437|nr:sigma-70 family RNA polymerase sigma factor [Microvirga pudoricolor]MBM6593727.1 sigma-70 family RNA polymerase sigma factor [Microvirga pudoricolor]